MNSETHLHHNDESHLGGNDVPVVHVVCVLFGVPGGEAEITIPARKVSVAFLLMEKMQRRQSLLFLRMVINVSCYVDVKSVGDHKVHLW